jgi:prophage regulatory protein
MSKYQIRQPLTSPDRLLRLPNVIAITGMSRSELYRRMAAGTFPMPVKLGIRMSAWPAGEVMSWIEAQIIACRAP